METAKEYLSQIKKIDSMICNKKQELYNLRLIATSFGSRASDVQVLSSPSGDSQERKILNYVVLEQEIDDDLIKYLMLKQKISHQIAELKDNRYVELLYKRYVECKGLKQVAREMCYEYQSIKNLHIEALDEFQREYLL